MSASSMYCIACGKKGLSDSRKKGSFVNMYGLTIYDHLPTSALSSPPYLEPLHLVPVLIDTGRIIPVTYISRYLHHFTGLADSIDIPTEIRVRFPNEAALDNPDYIGPSTLVHPCRRLTHNLWERFTDQLADQGVKAALGEISDKERKSFGRIVERWERLNRMILRGEIDLCWEFE